MASDFYDSLYSGYTGEYQLVSSLYRHGLDAVRPPADMGIDVVSLNLKEQLEDSTIKPETFFFQVKTYVSSIQFNPVLGRDAVKAEFYLKPDEVSMLCAGPGRALVCYVYLRNDNDPTNSLERPFIYFWIDGKLLNDLSEAGALYKANPCDRKFTLSFVLLESNLNKGHWYANATNTFGELIRNAGFLGVEKKHAAETGADEEAEDKGQDLYGKPYRYSIKGYLDYARAEMAEAAEVDPIQQI